LEEEYYLRRRNSLQSTESTVPCEVVVVDVEGSCAPTTSEDPPDDDGEAYWDSLDALETIMCHHSETDSPAQVCCDTALEYLAAEELEQALNESLKGASLPADGKLQLKLFQIQAEALVRLGRFSEALSVYVQILGLMDDELEGDQVVTVTDRADILYACGRASVRLRDYNAALGFFQQELQLVAKQKPLIAARVYHEMAHIYKNILGDSDKALVYYQHALTAETLVYKCLVQQSQECCSATDTRCAKHRVQIQSVVEAIQTTRKAIGRVYYEHGDLTKAFRISTMRTTIT
jgi:tetratricopeptide (TPR) repeat protein